MRWLLRIVLFLVGTVLLVLVVGFCWLYFYSRDLPDVGRLAQYAPTTVTQVSDPCLGSSVAIPYEAIGVNVRNAISAVETNEDDPGVLRTTVRGLLSEKLRERRTLIASSYMSRLMFCNVYKMKMLNWHLTNMRMAIQLERRYSRRQLFTIYANRMPLGSGLVGVHDAAKFYFHKDSPDLTLSEAALLVGLMRSPSYFSPVKHPDRALRRRNEVIDAMLENGTITLAEAQSAKAAPLAVVPNASATAGH